MAGHTLQPGEFELGLESPDGVTAAALRSNDAVVALDTELTGDLRAEGAARDLIRHIQQARKDADLVVTDRIAVVVDAPVELGEPIGPHLDFVADQVLATELRLGEVNAGNDAVDANIDGIDFRFTLARVS
ncbi:MAG: DUF5915 domain-containing protein [Acidimicrobiia bacterium]|nr:DUF5915 domain-containing protein [Acidimicrobiia bacterium]